MKTIKNLTAEQLRKSILQLAIQGKLVKQNPSDAPASQLLEKIYAEKQKLIAEKKIKKEKAESQIFQGEDKHWYEKIGKEVKDITEQIPFEIPTNWCWSRFATIFKLRNGFTPIRTNNLFWEKGTMPWFTIEDKRQQGAFITYTKQAITDKAYTNDRIVPANSVLLCCTASIGEVAYNKIPLITNQQFNGISIKPEYSALIIPLYLFYFCKTLKATLKMLTGTTTFGFISLSKIEQLFIPVPPLEEQKRIVAKIEELEEYIEQYNIVEKKLSKLESEFADKLKKSILQYAIEGKLVKQDPTDEPASILLERIQKEREKLINEGKLKKNKKDSIIFYGADKKPYEKIGTQMKEITEQIPFEIPTNWCWCRFSNIVQFNLGKTPDRHIAEFWKNPNIPWISISDMLDKQTIFYSKEQISNYAFKKCFKNNFSPKNTLLMSFKLTIGRVSILGIDAVHNEAIISIYPFINDEFIIRNYLFHVLCLLVHYTNSKDAIKGKTLNSESIRYMLIPLPPFYEQKRIVAKIEKLFQII